MPRHSEELEDNIFVNVDLNFEDDWVSDVLQQQGFNLTIEQIDMLKGSLGKATLYIEVDPNTGEVWALGMR